MDCSKGNINNLIGTTIDNRYKVLSKIKAGQAGTVFLVKQLGLKVDRAMKVLDPKQSGGVSNATFVKTFSEEIKLLSQLTHRNVVKILDVGLIPQTDVPYYVMDLVPSLKGFSFPCDLKRFVRSTQSKDMLLNVIDQLLDGLHYLHSHRLRVLHCDIAPKNILLDLTQADKPDLRITDLGVSKSLVPVDSNHNAAWKASSTYIYGTAIYSPHYAQHILNNEVPVSRRQLSDKYFPHYDLFCLGASLAECISKTDIPPGDRNFEDLIDNARSDIKEWFGKDWDILRHILSRLTNKDRDKCYRSVIEVKEDVNKLKSEYLWPLGVQEMAVGGSFKILTQPRERIYLSDRAYAIVSHPFFQRLHNLNQLNFVYLLYSGAKHSRFLHSVSAYEMSKRYVEGLLGDTNFRCIMNKCDYELFLAATLLHDIGHYPLAHALEDLASPSSGILKDYEMSRYFLTTRSKNNRGSIANLLSSGDWGFDLEALLRVISNKPPKTEAESLIQSMIDGAIDVDKVSYLLYDSMFSGARFGLGIDLNAFLSSLLVVPADQLSSRVLQLGISQKGIAPVESIITARYGMFSRVYWHHTNRSIMAMLQFAAARVFRGRFKSCTFKEYIRKTLFFSDLQALHFLNDRMLISRTKAEKEGEQLRNSISGLLDGSRSLYKRITSFTIDSEFYDDLVKSPFHKLEKIREALTVEIATILRRPAIGGDVLLDIPQVDKVKDVHKPVFVLRERHGLKAEFKELSDISKIAESVAGSFKKLVKKCRIFLHPELWKQCEGNDGLRKELISGIETTLRKQMHK